MKKMFRRWRNAVAYCLLFTATPLWALTLPFETGFESSEGYQSGGLNQNPWLIESGSVEIGTTGAYQGSQLLTLQSSSPNAPYTRLTLLGDGLPEEDILFIDLYLKPFTSALADLPQQSTQDVAGLTALVKVDVDNGEIYLASSLTGGTLNWTATEQFFPITNDQSTNWIRHTYRLNYSNKKWDLYLNDNLIAFDLNFIDPTLSGFSIFSVRGQGAFDLFSISATNPLFLDSDNDGIGDIYELANGLDSEENDRYGDVDHDGIINIEEIVRSLGVNNPDTDDDGIPDGLDIEPNSADTFTLTALPFVEGFESAIDFEDYNNWTSEGTSSLEIDTTVVHGGVKSAKLVGSAEPVILSNFIDGNESSPLWADLYVHPQFYNGLPPELAEGSATGLYFDHVGQLKAYDGTTLSWSNIGNPVPADQWQRLTVRLDYEQQTWSLWLNSLRIAQNFGFANPSPYLFNLRFRNYGTQPAYVDDIKLSDTMPTGLDNDGDGLTNEEEDPNGNGIIDEGETNPENSDNPAHDLDGDGMTNGVEQDWGLNPNIADTFGHDVPDLSTWQSGNIGTVDNHTLVVDRPGIKVTAIAAGIWDHAQDNAFYVYRTIRGDFEISTRVTKIYPLDGGSTMGLAVRASLDSNAAQATIRAGMIESLGHYHVYHYFRPTTGVVNTKIKQQNIPLGNSTSCWVKLKREGNIISSYYSSDGDVWHLHQQTAIDLANEAYVGFVTAGGSPGGKARYGDIHLTIDTDRDGLNDWDEINVHGTDPELADTDGDGYTDYQEVNQFLSNPTQNDLQTATLVQTLTGSQGVPNVGQWEVEDGHIHSIKGRGSVDYQITPSTDGIYKVSFEIGIYEGPAQAISTDFMVYVDGQYIERIHLNIFEGSVTGSFLTPWIKSGNHTITLFWDNVSNDLNIEIYSLNTWTVEGADTDFNGCPDWVDNRLAVYNGIANTSIVSKTSPYCLEGKGKYLSMLEVPSGINVKPAPSNRWYADIPLSSTVATQVPVKFENEGLEQTVSIEWGVTDVLTSQTITIRKGDALLLNAVSEGAQDGIVEITIGSNNYNTTYNTPVVHVFSEAGEFTVNGSYTGMAGNDSGNITVKVVEASFNGNPIGLLNQARQWINSDLPEDVQIDWDSRVKNVQAEPVEDGGIRFGFALDALEPRYVVARLGETGPIIAGATVRELRLSSSNDTGLKYTERYEDGSYRVEMPTVINAKYSDMRIVMEIVNAGVTFEDGSIYKELTDADFDDVGRIVIGFNKSEETLGSVCHYTLIYQDTQAIGTND